MKIEGKNIFNMSSDNVPVEFDWAATNPAAGPVSVEIAAPAEVTVNVEVLKGNTIDNPVPDDEVFCYTIASSEDTEEAALTAVKAMAQFWCG